MCVIARLEFHFLKIIVEISMAAAERTLGEHEIVVGRLLIHHAIVSWASHWQARRRAVLTTRRLERAVYVLTSQGHVGCTTTWSSPLLTIYFF